MKEFNELLTKLKELKIIQTSGDWEEDLPVDFWQKYFMGNFEEVAYNIEIETHRWYETSIAVIKIYGHLLGIRYITNVFSESSNYEDCFCKITFMEMKEVQVVSYLPI